MAKIKNKELTDDKWITPFFKFFLYKPRGISEDIFMMSLRKQVLELVLNAWVSPDARKKNIFSKAYIYNPRIPDKNVTVEVFKNDDFVRTGKYGVIVRFVDKKSDDYKTKGIINREKSKTDNRSYEFTPKDYDSAIVLFRSILLVLQSTYKIDSLAGEYITATIDPTEILILHSTNFFYYMYSLEKRIKFYLLDEKTDTRIFGNFFIEDMKMLLSNSDDITNADTKKEIIRLLNKYNFKINAKG